MRQSLAPSAVALLVGGVAFVLVAVVIARSPYTHANLDPAGYGRTQIAHLNQEYPFDGLGLADPSLASTGDPVQDGRALFFKYGCASCHGLEAQGGAVGPDLLDSSASEIGRDVREGPEGMPAYGTSSLSDDDVEKIIAFLKSQ